MQTNEDVVTWGMHVQQARKVAQKLKSEYNNKIDNNKDNYNTRKKGPVFSPVEQHTVQAGRDLSSVEGGGLGVLNMPNLQHTVCLQVRVCIYTILACKCYYSPMKAAAGRQLLNESTCMMKGHTS